MKFRVIRDKKLRQKYFNNEIYVIAYKFLITNLYLKRNPLFFFNMINFNFFHTYLLQNAKTRIFNYCILTGRARGIINFFHLSRLTFREMASFGLISGVKRSVW